jgi:aspartyl/asparaginyl beta-hydroxylase (cupin superfamily)
LAENPSLDASQLFQAAAAALGRNDPVAARPLFERLVKARPTDADAWVGFAQSCRGMGDDDGAMTAVDKALALSPGHVRALMMKADHLAKAGDGRAAQTFYGAAVARAPALETMSAELRGEVHRAQREVDHYRQSYRDHLIETLAKAGFDSSASSRRFAQSVDLLLGKKRIFFQSPQSYYFPELPQRQFYERAEFPWLGALEAKTDSIRNELQALLGDHELFSPYVKSDTNRPQREYGRLLDNRDWSAYFLIEYGEVVAEAAARCPNTMAALEGIPLCEATGRMPSVLFSLLRPGVRIPPHTGYTNARLIVHLPLIIPERCALRVGNERRSWRLGEALIFDDSIEHEAWNESGELRAVLLLDVWRPELSAEERALVAALLGAVGTYSGG